VTSFSLIPSGAAPELADDIRELFAELASTLPDQHRAYSGECHPSIDVRETDAAVEVVVDVAGTPRDAVRVLFRGGVLLVAGEKAPARAEGPQTFHLVEREFGRFARAVRVTGAFDVANAHAAIADGELVIVLPKIPERRGQAHRVPVAVAPDGPA
jgi:HSP20 family protein